jgi:transposase
VAQKKDFTPHFAELISDETNNPKEAKSLMNIRQGYVFSFEDAINLQPRSRLEIILATLDFDDVIAVLSKADKQHRGPDGYRVETKLNSLIAMRVYNMSTFTELAERLTHDPVLRYNCGFDVFGKVPSIATFSRFYSQLTDSESLQELFKKQVQQAESMGLLDTSSIAIDASKVTAHEKSVPRKNIKDDGQSANWGSKLDTNGNQITWFGYKLHIATDVKSELPVALSITPASTNDGIMAEIVLKECSNNLNSKPQYYLMDAGYDQKSIYELIRKDYKAQAIIPLNHRGAKEPPEGLDWDATPICSAGYRMTYWGGSNGVNKFRCPHVMGKCDCPFGSSWCSDSNYGMVIKTRARQDSRLFTVPHRGTLNWKHLYNKRTTVERCFGRLKEHLGLETGLNVRGIKKVKTHAYLSAITMIASVVAVNTHKSSADKAA